MILVAESIYEGTWASGPPPRELMDFELMEAMHWSWKQLNEETPRYVRRYCWDLLQAKRRAQQDAQERATREAHNGH